MAQQTQQKILTKPSSWKRSLLKYLFEFFIVFFGVYLAFLFTDYQDGLRNKKIRIKYYDSLIQEFEVFYAHLEEENEKITRLLSIAKAIDGGKLPKLEPANLYYLYNGITVKAAFNSSNFEAVHEGLLKSIIRGVYLLEKLEKKVTRLDELQRAILYPLLASGGSHYDSNGDLLKHLEWYPELIREIHQLNLLLQDIVKNRAIPEMASERDVLQNSPYWKSIP